MIKVTTKLVSRGPDRLSPLKKLLERAHGSFASVGWQTPARYPDGPLVAQVAIWNEFGTQTAGGDDHVPARPFMRPAIDEGKQALGEIRQKQLERIVQQKVNVEQALHAMAYPLVVAIQNKIKSNLPPKLADVTIARKRKKGVAPVTLIDTGRMLRELSVMIHLSAKDALSDSKTPPSRSGRSAVSAHDKQAVEAERVANRAAKQAELKAKREARRQARAGQQPRSRRPRYH